MDNDTTKVRWLCVGKVRTGEQGEWTSVRSGLVSDVHNSALPKLVLGAHYELVNAQEAPSPEPEPEPVVSPPEEEKAQESVPESVEPEPELKVEEKPKPKKRGRRKIKKGE